VTNISLPVIQM